MKLSLATSNNLIFVNKNWSTKEEILDGLISALYEQKKISDKKAFKESVMEREKVSQTGMENGFAIPHGKSNSVKEASFAVVTLEKPLASNKWESIDESNEVEIIFLLAIPDSEKGSTHLKLLADLSVSLMKEEFVNRMKEAKSSEDIMSLLTDGEVAERVNQQSPHGGKQILAVTACATGIAHTYMAAEALEQAASRLGVTIKVEKQGANGIENRITMTDIQKADGVIFATDIAAKDKERFNGLPFIQTKVAEPLKNGSAMVEKVLTKPDGVVNASSSGQSSNTTTTSTSSFSTFMQAVMTGISYMIPILVAAGVMIGISQIGASFFGLSKDIGSPDMASHSNQIVVLLHFIGLTGNLAMRFMYPVFTAFMAYSIADRPALASGFIGGAFAAGLHYSLWGMSDGIPSGFFGALILGLVAGVVSKFLNDKVKLHQNLQAMKPMLIIPGLSILAVFFVNYLFVDPVFGGLNAWLQEMVIKYQDSGEVVLSIIIACLTAFDLGGPVNKAAGAVAIGMAADGIFPLTPRVLAIVIPPIGIGLATILDKYIVGRRVFDDNLRVTGRTSLILGFLAIGEGAIPFALQNPLITIPINMIGASLGAVTAVILGAVQWYPLPAIWGWPLVENFVAYGIGLIVGILFIALSNIFIRNYLQTKKAK